MDLTMTSRFSWWWLHAFFLVILQHTWVSSEGASPTNETYWGNTTTGHDLLYITNKETSATPNTALGPYPSKITAKPDLVNITNEEISITSSTTIETYKGDNTTRPDMVYITNKETSATPNTALGPYPSKITTKPNLVNITNEEISATSSTTIETYKGNITTRPDMVYITNKETSETSNTTLESYPSNVSVGPDLTNVFEGTSRTPSSTLETSPNNATTGPELSYISEQTSEIFNITMNTYINNVTTAIDLIYTGEEGPTTLKTTVETYPSNVTTEAQLTYINDETSGTPHTTIQMERTSYPGITKPSEIIYSDEPTTGTPNRTLQTEGATHISGVSCLQEADCPPLTICTDQGGFHICQCHLGSYFHHHLGCVTARTFPARIPFSVLYWNEMSGNTTERNNDDDEIEHMAGAQYHEGARRVEVLFQNILGHIPGYLSTSVIDVQLNEGLVTIVHSFSTLYPVTEEDVWKELTVSPMLCTEPHPSCMSPLTINNYQDLNLCDFDICDTSSSNCHNYGGLVTCECRRAYYKFSPTDRSCRACGSGFRWTGSGCERCSIGFSGFNCEEPYLLVVIVESSASGIFLVSLITLLIFYFRRKKPEKSTFIDSNVLRAPTDQPSLQLPRAQFSWRREWEWNGPPGKVLTEVHREADSPDETAIHMTTFGDPARFSAPNSNQGQHNLSFISE